MADRSAWGLGRVEIHHQPNHQLDIKITLTEWTFNHLQLTATYFQTLLILLVFFFLILKCDKRLGKYNIVSIEFHIIVLAVQRTHHRTAFLIAMKK